MSIHAASGFQRSSLTMRDAMTPSPHAVGSNQKLSFARELMSKHHLRHLPVLRSGKLLGVLSRRDLDFLVKTAGPECEIELVADLLPSDVYTTKPNALVHDVAQIMADQKQSCAVVMDQSHIVGIFTVTDALKRLAAELAGRR